MEPASIKHHHPWNVRGPFNRTTGPRSNIAALVTEIWPALLGFEIALDVVERVHGTAQPLPDQLIELDSLREREIAPHLHRDLVVLERSQVTRGDLAGDRESM